MCNLEFSQRQAVKAFLLCPLFPTVAVTLFVSVVSILAGYPPSLFTILIAAGLFSYFIAFFFGLPMLVLAMAVLPLNLFCVMVASFIAGSVGLNMTWSLLDSDGASAFGWTFRLAWMGGVFGLFGGGGFWYLARLPVLRQV